MFKAIIAVLIGAVVMLVIFSKVEISSSSSSSETTTTETSSSTSYTLSISGEVNKKGTYTIAAGGTLSDLITAAGGVNSNADAKAYDEDYVLEDNQTFYIAPLYDSSDTCSQTQISKVNINSATSEELLAINGVKSNIATNIVEYRTSKGDFKRIEDLKEVTYIGAATFEKMKNYVTIK